MIKRNSSSLHWGRHFNTIKRYYFHLEAQEQTMQVTFSKVIQGAVSACLVVVFATAHAEDGKVNQPLSSGPGKVAVLDLETAVMTTDFAKEKLKAMESQSDYIELKKKIDSLQKDAEKKSTDAKKEGPTWTADQAANYRKDMDFMQKDMQLADQKMRALYADMEGSIMKEMDDKIKKAINECITEQKISLLIRAEAVYTASSDSNITSDVTAKLNKAK